MFNYAFLLTVAYQAHSDRGIVPLPPLLCLLLANQTNIRKEEPCFKA